MQIEQLYRDYSVQIADETSRHYRHGWVNVACPHCTGNPGFHLGYSIEDNYYRCFRCGWHPVNYTLSKLLHISEADVRTLVRQYGGMVTTKAPTHAPRIKAFKTPVTQSLLPAHAKYLEKRKFDPELIKQQWHIRSTTPVSTVDNINFKHRIFIPIMWDNAMVSYQARDVVGTSTAKYLMCPADRELINCKSILYGAQKHWTDTIICVEGVTDVWRFGVNAVATFGIQYKPVQMHLLARKFKRVVVVFDDDPQAIVQAKRLVAELNFRGTEAAIEQITGDPGDMSQQEADYLVKAILRRFKAM